MELRLSDHNRTVHLALRRRDRERTIAKTRRPSPIGEVLPSLHVIGATNYEYPFARSLAGALIDPSNAKSTREAVDLLKRTVGVEEKRIYGVLRMSTMITKEVKCPQEPASIHRIGRLRTVSDIVGGSRS